MADARFRDSELGKIVRGLAIMISAILMIVPAYISYELGPTKLGFEAVPSMGITLELFAVAIVIFIVAVGPEKFRPKSRTP
jgi:hypothetical protein